MKISISPWYESKEGIFVEVGSAEVVCQQAYCGIGIISDGGLFGIAERDGVIEILHDGDLLLDSDQIKALIERKRTRDKNRSAGDDRNTVDIPCKNSADK